MAAVEPIAPAIRPSTPYSSAVISVSRRVPAPSVRKMATS